MADWAVSPTADTAWQLDAGDFIRRLRERWPDASAEPSERGNRLADFTVPLEDGSTVEGYLARSGNALWMDGAAEPAAVVAAWLREQAPADQELMFYDQAYEVTVPLTPGITAGEIAAAASG